MIACGAIARALLRLWLVAALLLAPLTAAQWVSPAAAGWSVCDVVVHLALTEEAVVQDVELAGGQRRQLGRRSRC